MPNRQITRALLLGVLAIVGIIAVQSYWVLNTWNINEQEFEEKINLILYNTACSIAEVNNADLPKKNIIKRRSSNYYIVNIDSEINPGMLEQFLQEGIEAWALNIDFEYGIYDCTSSEMVYGNYCNYELEGERTTGRAALLPVSELKTSNYYFGIRFPTRSNYLFQKMQLSVFFSLILLLTIIFFAYAMYVMLRQSRLSNMQKDFINNMTHEFKTPLSTIKIAADYFGRHPAIKKDERLLTYANIIKDQNLRLNDQVERVLNIVKFEQNNFNLKQETVDLGETIRHIVNNEQLRIRELGGSLRVQLPEKACYIEADQFHLSNVLYNLLDNAVKYRKEKPVIDVELAYQKKGYYLKISDQGIGIPKEYQSNVFEKFYRIPTGNIHNVKGFGIGLYYVQKICEAHGWTIKLESEEGEYARFSIFMPNQ
ncbi:MAG TPA: HAMP domain-containing sensor histidine kinase [Saprospiraceae bacterium]|nr:HAMP domain-containing sensor histidine kinase [Saprospiraceae bacterium]